MVVGSQVVGHDIVPIVDAVGECQVGDRGIFHRCGDIFLLLDIAIIETAIRVNTIDVGISQIGPIIFGKDTEEHIGGEATIISELRHQVFVVQMLVALVVVIFHRSGEVARALIPVGFCL